MSPRRLTRKVARNDVVLVPVAMVGKRITVKAVPCTGQRQFSSDTAQFTITTFTVGSTLRVVVIGGGVGYGTTVSVIPQKTSTGYSFTGNTCKATTGSSCQDGSLLSTITSITGSIAGSSISYSYTIEVYCGDVFTCIENGTFAGTKPSGSGVDGTWFGKQTWTSECCTTRQSSRVSPPRIVKTERSRRVKSR